MENKTIDKIGVGKNAGQVTKIELKASNNVYEVYSDGVFIGRTRLMGDGLWTVEPHWQSWEYIHYWADKAAYAADLLDTFYKLKS